ncbi:DUF998 domain-containing protein [Weissella halotolerans]|uniref:DUF998 domain-containing protein n=1 Tax=Weissella halotolerans DSM 20190 TaxID=1123500 RepID=A0A0R2G1H1_9LACO|nr:DUF998 domain-containing protein [Weissella halotolerans]KRN33675.1 hypothetical protein IV68_GL000483 [Weissella halotolerans DSM 20190]
MTEFKKSDYHFIAIPKDIAKGEFAPGLPLTITHNAGNLTIRPAEQNTYEVDGIRYFLFAALLSAVIALINFFVQDTPTVALTGANSMTQLAIYLSLFFGIISFFTVAVRLKLHGASHLHWRNIITLTISYGLMTFALLALFFKFFSTAFIGLRLDLYTTAGLIGFIVGLTTYSLVAAANNINFSTITFVLIATLFGGILFSMVTNGHPNWWQYNFSYLGTDHVKNAIYFNFTLIFSGLIMLTLVDYLFTALQADFHHNRPLFFLRILFSLLAITLAGVGLFPNNPGWTHIVHDHIAQLLVTWVLIMIISIKWLLPKASHDFVIMSYLIGGLLIFADISFQRWHYLSLTGWEIVACGLVLLWLILLLIHLRHIVLPDTTFKTEIID